MVAVISLAAFLNNRRQLKNAQATLEDRRLDERVKAILGENLLLISSLTEQARTSLQEAKESAGEVGKIRDEANQTFQMQLSQSNESRQKLEEALLRADVVTARLDKAADEAEADSKAIGQFREAITRSPSILHMAREIGIDEGYRITSGVNSGALSTSMEWDTGFDRRRVEVYPLMTGGKADDTPMSLIPAAEEYLQRSFVGRTDQDGEISNTVIVTHEVPPSEFFLIGQVKIPIVSIDHFRQYLIDVKAPTLPKNVVE
jgi:hypothetical protein